MFVDFSLSDINNCFLCDLYKLKGQDFPSMALTHVRKGHGCAGGTTKKDASCFCLAGTRFQVGQKQTYLGHTHPAVSRIPGVNLVRS